MKQWIIAIDGKPLARTGAFQGGVHGDILQANQDNVVPTTDGLDNVRRFRVRTIAAQYTALYEDLARRR